MPVISNQIFAFASAGAGKVTVTVQSTGHGLINGSVVEILNSVNYIGTYVIESVGVGSFRINATYSTNEQGCVWQLSRSRPVIVNPEGETIDTLRQAVNQVSNDLGNKTELNSSVDDKRDIVKAINSLSDFIETESRLKNLINSIACN